MPTISTRVPEDLEAELEAYLDEERLDRSTAVRKLLAEGLEAWRQERALASGRGDLSPAIRSVFPAITLAFSCRADTVMSK